MMSERRTNDKGPWGILNDWDLAKETDAEPSKRAVCIIIVCQDIF